MFRISVVPGCDGYLLQHFASIRLTVESVEYGSLSDFGSAFKTWSDEHQILVFPPLVDDPGPFTLTITPPQGGTISVSPVAQQYDKGTLVTLVASPDQGNELLKWTGDASGSTETVVLTMTRNMTASA